MAGEPGCLPDLDLEIMLQQTRVEAVKTVLCPLHGTFSDCSGAGGL
ncbi:MAG: hypothetical protein ACLUAR_16645 [Pilosibacter sp.]